jgi:hypothetical protein
MPNYSGKWTPSQVLQARGQDLWPINGPFFYVDDVFSTYLYVGNSGLGSTNSNGLDLSGEGGLVWVKDRDSSTQHLWFDTERGGTNYLTSAGQAAASTGTDGISFLSNGWSTAPNGVYDLNSLSANYTSWSFRKQQGFFDQFTSIFSTGTNVFTATSRGTLNGDGTITMPHNIGSAPGLIIWKVYSGDTGSWRVWHRSASGTGILNETGYPSNTYIGNVTSTSFDITDNGFMGNSRSNYSFVFYVFAHDDQRFGDTANQSIIKCGTYTGNGTTASATTEQAGPEIDLGWEPQWVMIKRSDGTAGDWFIFDMMRGLTIDFSGQGKSYLRANNTGAESDLSGSFAYLRLTSTGFKITAGTGAFFNENGASYIYVAIRRPMKTPTAGTEVFAMDTRNGSGTGKTPNYQVNFPVDMALAKEANSTSNWNNSSRAAQKTYLIPNTNDAGGNQDLYDYSYQNGYFASQATNSNSYAWMFKRGTGFLDVVGYRGNGTAGTTYSHSLGVVPELMIVKVRGNAGDWQVYSSALGATKYLVLNETNAEATSSNQWNDTAPTASVFTLGNIDTNESGRYYIAYLFATLDGVSKVGSYTGTAADLDVDCGFTSGARFILIKRTDATGFWYVYDSTRGIVSGNDPYLLLDQNFAETTTTDYVDPLSSGFTVTSSASGSINASGGTYIFLAIA